MNQLANGSEMDSEASEQDLDKMEENGQRLTQGIGLRKGVRYVKALGMTT
jgi:hypothetical protein